MRHSKINYNEVVTYIGKPITYKGKTLLNTNDIVHIERQMTAKKIVVFAIKEEETFLSENPNYVLYQAQVRKKLIPFIW